MCEIIYLSFFCNNLGFSMEEDCQYVDDDFFYPSDFEEDLKNVVGIIDILGGTHTINKVVCPITFGETYFDFLDDESQLEDDEDFEGLGEVEGDGHRHLSNDNIPSFIDESSLPSFEHISIDSFPKYVHFTLAIAKLMLDCLQSGFNPPFNQICKVDANFRPLLQFYGCPFDANDVFYTIEHWKKFT